MIIIHLKILMGLSLRSGPPKIDLSRSTITFHFDIGMENGYVALESHKLVNRKIF